MRRTLVPLASCLALLVGASSVASAQGKPGEKAAPAPGGPAMSMKPAPEMDRVKWMVATWQCTGKMLASSMGPEHPTEAEVKGEMILDGMWVNFHYREKKTAQNPMPVSADEVWTYDAAEKMWDRLVIDNTGGWAAGTAKGWEKGKLVWSSDGMMGGQKMKFRDTFVEKNPREINYTGEFGTPDGKWSAISEINCKK